jgi:hypothetical protein
MLIFDGIVGNNDRHSYNWGVIQSIKVNEPVRFAPIYDTARGLFWNISEKGVENILSLTDKKGINSSIEKYVLSSKPKIGWEGEKSLSHVELLQRIYETETGISKQNFKNLVSFENLNKCLDVINGDFSRLLSVNRRNLMSKCLTLRFEKLNEFI